MRMTRLLAVGLFLLPFGCNDTPLPVLVGDGGAQDGKHANNDSRFFRSDEGVLADGRPGHPEGGVPADHGPRPEGPCQPQCAGKSCGAGDGCGGTCGEGQCAAGLRCVHDACICDAVACPIGCCKAGSCSAGSADDACGRGTECVDCAGLGLSCNASQACDGCRASCGGKTCGQPDGCGGTCSGSCPGGQACENGMCICNGSSCPSGCCSANSCRAGSEDSFCGQGGAACTNCAFNGQRCEAQSCKSCVPSCGGKTCGQPDGCGGTCSGSCPGGQICEGGACICNARSCPSGCCQGVTCRAGTEAALCGKGGVACVNCVTAGQLCSNQSCQACVPNCDGKACGLDDGCGTPCGCPTGRACDEGVCVFEVCVRTGKSPDGTWLNPGCDPSVQSSGFTTVANAYLAGSGQWQFANGTKYWSLIAAPSLSGTATLTGAGADYSAWLRSYAPDCTVQKNSLRLNPGCYGVTDPSTVRMDSAGWSEATGGATGSGAFFTVSTSYWSLDASSRVTTPIFTDAGPLPTLLLAVPPTNCTETMGGVTLNPGCDPDVKATGFRALAVRNDRSSGEDRPIWLATNGKKWWMLDVDATGASRFTGAGNDVAAWFRLAGPGCGSLVDNNSVELNPGCDSGVVGAGIDTVAWMADASAVYALVTRGKKWWVWRSVIGGTTSSWIAAGSDIAVKLRQMTP